MDLYIPRITISGLRGGSGKTIVTLSILSCLRDRGLKVVPFKKGPDYIDAGWLSKAAGMPCYNLDLFMMDRDQILKSFYQHTSGVDLAIIEGNRGLFDGLDHEASYSTAEIAKLIGSGIILVIDCTKVTGTVAAMVLGCMAMDRDIRISGVVLNRVGTSRQESVIRKSIEERCRIPVVGTIPRLRKNPLPERHMGLLPFHEHNGLEDSIYLVREIGEKYIDIEKILEISRGVSIRINNMDLVDPVRISETRHVPKIGIIRDSAFQFYYEENLEELKRRGAILIEISPIGSGEFPEIDALYIGGGFPETHAIALAENRRFREYLYSAIEEGLPVYAECGGLMYLGEGITLEDRTYPMVGVLPLKFIMKSTPQAHGYTVVQVEKENPYFRVGSILKGHEFHYSMISDFDMNGVYMIFSMQRGKGIHNGMDGICYKNVLATYTHIHALGCPEWSDAIVELAKNYREMRG